MADRFVNNSDTVIAPSRHVVAVVPSDSTDLTDTPKALYIGTGGDVKVIGIDAPTGATGVVFKNVSGGQVLDVRPRRVLAAGTTAADIVALF